MFWTHCGCMWEPGIQDLFSPLLMLEEERQVNMLYFYFFNERTMGIRIMKISTQPNEGISSSRTQM